MISAPGGVSASRAAADCTGMMIALSPELSAVAQVVLAKVGAVADLRCWSEILIVDYSDLLLVSYFATFLAQAPADSHAVVAGHLLLVRNSDCSCCLL